MDARDADYATYRISVGKRHRVEPRQIVGAIANEGGLGRDDFGHIDIRGDHSLVELPADLSPETLSALERTRISGKLIELTPDGGQAESRRPSYEKKKSFDKGGAKSFEPSGKKKPRTKKPRP